MNAEAITTEVTKIVTELRSSLPKGGRKQYPAAKHQIATLTELGLIEAMPRGFGYQDAAEVIRQATSGARVEGAMNASGEGEEWTTEATALFKLLNPAPEVEESDEEYTERDGIYDRSEPTAGHGMTMSVEVKDGFVVREWMHSHYVDYIPRNPDARWGHIGKSPVELNIDGFRKRPAAIEVWDDWLTADPNLW